MYAAFELPPARCKPGNIWLEVSEVKGQTAPQAFAAFKMESSLSKDGGGVGGEIMRDALMWSSVQLSSYHSEKPSSKSFYILCEYVFVSQCCGSPVIETRIMSIQHYLKRMQLVII